MSLGRIILKSTTRISLNDRFTVLRNENPQASNNGYAGAETRQFVQASRKNQRLAAQMERRPAVMAALKPKKNLGNRLSVNENQTVSVKQRLALPGRLRIPDFRGSQRGITNIRIRGGIASVRAKFQGRIGTDNRGASTSFRGRGRGGRFGNQRGGAGNLRGGGGLRGGLRGRGGQISGRGTDRGRGFSRGRGSSRIFRRGT